MTPQELSAVIEAAKQPNPFDYLSAFIQGGVGITILGVLFRIIRWSARMEVTVEKNTEATCQGFARNREHHNELRQDLKDVHKRVDELCKLSS